MNNNLDQAVGTLALSTIERSVMDHVNHALMMRKDDGLIAYVQEILVGMQMRGIRLAYLLYEWKQNCQTFGIEPEDWEDHVFAATGLSLQTIRKYVTVWSVIFANPSVPDGIKDDLAGKPMEGLLLLPAAVREGQLTEDDWNKLADAEDKLSMRNVIRKARGEATSSGTAVRITLMRDGVLMARRGDELEPVGYLKRDGEGIVEIAVERIIRAAGILEE